MNRTRWGMLLVVLGCVAFGLGAAPVAPSFQEVQGAMKTIRSDLARPDAVPATAVAGWTAYLDAIDQALASYQAARTEADRQAALGRLSKLAQGLRASSWGPATEVRELLQAWITPRLSLDSAVKNLERVIAGLPATSDPTRKENRDYWVQFVSDDLGTMLRAYESAATAADRLAALDRIHKGLAKLSSVNQKASWAPSLQLHSALRDLFDQPNLEATADVPTLAPQFERDVAITGTIQRRGQTSYVTAGRKTGFGLLESDDGIAFFNSQLLTSYTPIRGFQEQVASDPQGQRAARMYYFTAATQDFSEVIVRTVIRSTGLDIDMSNRHNIQVLIGAAPIPGAGFGRMLAALLGQNRETIRQKVYQGAAGRMREGVVQGSQEESAERAAAAEAEQNARLAQFLIGNDTLAYGKLAIADLDLRSRPEFAWIRGIVRWRDQAGPAAGADTPQPKRFATWSPGVTADLHLPSLLTNLSAGYLQSDQARETSTLLIETRSVPPGGAPKDAVKTTPNADYATLLQAITAMRDAKDPKALAIRVKRPSRPPQFAADPSGRLIALIHDLRLDVPAPAGPNGGLGLNAGPPAKVYRMESPLAEVLLAIRYEPANGATPARFVGQVEAFDPGPRARIVAIDDDEDKPTPLNAFTSALVLGIARARVQGQALTVPVEQVAIPGIVLRNVSALDPSGWLRVELQTGDSRPATVAGSPPAAR